MMCDEWTAVQVKAFRLIVNSSVTWANWDEELLALQEIQESDFDLSLTGFDPGEIDKLLVLEDEEKPTLRRHCRRKGSRGQAICGFWVRIDRLRGRNQSRSRHAPVGRSQAAADGDRPALRHRTRRRVARSRRPEWPRRG